MEQDVQHELELVQDQLLRAVAHRGPGALAQLGAELRETAVGAAARWAGGELALDWPVEHFDLPAGEARRLGQRSASLGDRAVRALLGPPGRFDVTSEDALAVVAVTDGAPQVEAAMVAALDASFAELGELGSWSTPDRKRFREAFELGVGLGLAESALGRLTTRG